MTSSLKYIPFFLILKILDYRAKIRHFFPPKFFFNFRGQKLKISKIRDSHLLELFNYYHYQLYSFLEIRFTNVFLMNFQTFILFRTKIAGGDVTKSAISKKMLESVFLHQTT